MKIFKDKKNSSHFNNLDIYCFCKEFSDLTEDELTSIKKIKSENFKKPYEENSNPISISDHRSHHFLISIGSIIYKFYKSTNSVHS